MDIKNLKYALTEEIESRKQQILFEECRSSKNGSYSEYDQEYALNAAKDQFKDDLVPAFKSVNRTALLLLEQLIDGVI